MGDSTRSLGVLSSFRQLEYCLVGNSGFLRTSICFDFVFDSKYFSYSVSAITKLWKSVWFQSMFPFNTLEKGLLFFPIQFPQLFL